MSRVVFLAVCFFIAGPAHAQQPAPPPPPISVNLFFEGEGELKTEQRTVPRGNFTEDGVKAAIDALAGGSQTLGPVLPKSAKLEAVLIGEDGTYFLNFNEAVVMDFPGGITQELLTVTALCQTVFANFDASAVQLLVKGREMKTLAGHVDIESPITRAQCERMAKRE